MKQAISYELAACLRLLPQGSYECVMYVHPTRLSSAAGVRLCTDSQSSASVRRFTAPGIANGVVSHSQDGVACRHSTEDAST